MKIRDDYLAFGVPDYSDAEIEAVSRVMRSGWVGMGPETLTFEEELSNFIGAPELVTVNSCTSALFLALLVEGIGPGDEVIVPSLTWCATANAALYLGAVPVFCDVGESNLCLTPETVAAKLSPRTKAVIVVHYGGYAVDVEQLRGVLPETVAIIEDAAHALGAAYGNGKKVGTSGNTVCYSFYANKNLSTAEGGAMALFDGNKAERLRMLRMSGVSSHAWSRYVKPANAFISGIDALGYKMNFTDLQAAIGRVQLARLEHMAATRLVIAERYRQRLSEAGLTIPFQRSIFDANHARHLLVGCFEPDKIGLPRNELLLKLRDRNIGASIHYHPLHVQPLYNRVAQQPVLPVTESLAETIMTLPISARMTVADVDYVVDHLVDIVRTEAAK